MKTLTRWAAVSAWTVVGRMAAGVFGRCLVIGVVGLLLVMSAGADEVYRPVVPIVQVAHVGEPVSGVAEATYSYVAPPQIDAAGNVLFGAVMHAMRAGGGWSVPPITMLNGWISTQGAYPTLVELTTALDDAVAGRSTPI